MLGGRGHAGALEPAREGDAGGARPGRASREAAVLLGDEAARAGDVEHGREVDVDPDRREAGAGGGALGAGDLRARARPSARR